MNITKKVLLLIFLLSACTNSKVGKLKHAQEKTYYSSNGFALIYNDDLYTQGVIDKKLSNDQIMIMHSSLKRNTRVKLINPQTSKIIETKIHKKANYPKLFNIVVSKKIATILELDFDNPYIEFFEIKKNKTFIAEKSNTFEEEKKVAETVPVGEIQINDLSEIKKNTQERKNNFIIVISDFYYFNTADNLKNELIGKTNINRFSVKKINDNKYRLSAGPFKNFNALKSIYISLNNLGFEELNIIIDQK